MNHFSFAWQVQHLLIHVLLSRLVNVFVEPLHKKTRRSISELAEAIGLPRALIDIRHGQNHFHLTFAGNFKMCFSWILV